ncbi:MAG: acetate--CoA ligase family protein [Rhodopila sp.]|nr:acetate--CoA ligase family protein [Rhodopila sp.]
MDALPGLLDSGSLDHAFRPRSVAILGASDDPSRISGRTLHYMKKAGYAGAIYPVNNRRDMVQGIRAFHSLADVPEIPDIALIALPAAVTLSAVRDCAARGVKAAIIYASGFAEGGAAGHAMQDEVTAVARAGGVRLFGPNCLGMFHSGSAIIGTFSSAFDAGLIKDGPVAVASQSGAYAGHIAYMARERNLGIGYWVSTGNEADIDLSECIAWLARQDDVKVIMAYSEGVRNGERFIAALRTAHENHKPIVFMKVGASQAGAHAAESHTAALAGADSVYDALFAQYGVFRAQTTEEQVDIAYACSHGAYPRGRRLGIITVSGGFGIQLCDAAERQQLDVAPMPDTAYAKLKAAVPFGNMHNPCDVTAGVLNDMSHISTTFRTMYEEGGYDSLIGSFTMLPASPTYGEKMKQAIQAGTDGYLDRPTALCLAAGPDVMRSYDEAGFLVYTDSERAARSIAALAGFREAFEQHLNVPVTDRRLARDLGTEALSEAAAQKLLSGAGIPFLPSTVVDSADAAASAAVRFAAPVAMKIVSPDILHKTEIGGVLLGVAGEAAVREGYTTLIARAAEKAPNARIEGVLVTPMAPDGVETIIGVTHDPVFGAVVMFGLGGIFTELFRDVTFRIAPFDVKEAHRMIAATKGSKLLKGFRGRPPADIDALAEMLARVSQFSAANAGRLRTIDLNPVLVCARGEGVVALDAVLVPERT